MPLKTPEEDNEKEEVDRAVAKEISVGTPTILLELDGIFALKNIFATLKAFLSKKHVFALLGTGFGSLRCRWAVTHHPRRQQEA